MLNEFLTTQAIKCPSPELKCALEKMFCEFSCSQNEIKMDGTKIMSGTTLVVDLAPLIAAEVTKQLTP